LGVAALLVLVGCLPVTGGTSGPTIQSLNPASHATGVPITTTVSATFNTAIESGSGTFTLSGSSAVAGTVGYNGATRAWRDPIPF
jgi:hypothetical protein